MEDLVPVPEVFDDTAEELDGEEDGQITRAHEGRGLQLANITGCDDNCRVGSID